MNDLIIDSNIFFSNNVIIKYTGNFLNRNEYFDLEKYKENINTKNLLKRKNSIENISCLIFENVKKTKIENKKFKPDIESAFSPFHKRKIKVCGPFKTVTPIGYHFHQDDHSFNVWNTSNDTSGFISTLQIDSLPYVQTLKNIQLDEEENVSFPFNQWSITQQENAANQLKECGIPIEWETIKKIYLLLQKHEKALCENSSVMYPAKYKVIEICLKVADLSSNTLKINKDDLNEETFVLEVFSNKKVSLLIQKKETLLGEGTFKQVRVAYNLGYPLGEVAQTLSIFRDLANLPAMQEEENLIKFKHFPWIAKTYQIFYTHQGINQEPFVQQNIVMKRYHNEFFNSLNTHLTGQSFTKEQQFSYSIQLMKAIGDMHREKMIYGDLKPENILLDNGEIFKFIDFGGSYSHGSQAMKSILGSPCYLAPEIINQEHETYGYGIDIWSAGCILWMIWFKRPVPWFSEACSEEPSFKFILIQMRSFEESISCYSNPMAMIIKNMLRLDPSERWSAEEVLSQIISYQSQVFQK